MIRVSTGTGKTEVNEKSSSSQEKSENFEVIENSILGQSGKIISENKKYILHVKYENVSFCVYIIKILTQR